MIQEVIILFQSVVFKRLYLAGIGGVHLIQAEEAGRSLEFKANLVYQSSWSIMRHYQIHLICLCVSVYLYLSNELSVYRVCVCLRTHVCFIFILFIFKTEFHARLALNFACSLGQPRSSGPCASLCITRVCVVSGKHCTEVAVALILVYRLYI